ncbi:DNA-binding protein [Bacteroidia bacterium]|nr:DNA-binding protein [Bacteroidia bacterium]
MTTELTVNKKNEIILYQPDNTVQLEVLVENETVWLNRQQLALLFDRDVKTIGKHINNALKEELAEFPTIAKSATIGNTPYSTVANFATVQNAPYSVVAKFATTQIEGNREILRNIEYYNLDMILSVGYRVKSNRGIQFRAWANRVLKEYILRGYAINQRFEQVDNKLFQHEQRLLNAEKQIDFFVRTSLPPVEGVFYNGQIFDAYKFVVDLIEMAKKEIVVIDNYIDVSILALLTKRKEGVKATIFTANLNKIQTDLNKHNAQYAKIFVEEKPNIHDRFIVIDNDLYHIGASLKDLGKKLFAFSKMEMSAADLLKNMG